MLFSISTANGLLATFGIAIMNGVVLAIYIRDLKASGLGARDAATHAAAMPLPPMIMMAQVAARGFLPMARSTRAGAEIQRPLTTVVIGRLISTTLPPGQAADGLSRGRWPASGGGPARFARCATAPKCGGAQRATHERDKVSTIGMWIRNSVLLPRRGAGDYLVLVPSGSPACWTAMPLPTRSRRS